MITLIDTKRLQILIRNDCFGIGILFLHRYELVINILCFEINIDFMRYAK